MMIFNGFPEISALLMSQQLVDAIMNLLPDSTAQALKEDLKSYQRWMKSDERPMQAVADGMKDYRFRWLLVRNFRRYDQVEAQSDAYLGIKLQDDEGQVCSKIFVLGKNGVGKSTLFNAAEYLFTRRISEAEYRHIHNLQSYVGGLMEDIIVVKKDLQIIRETPQIPLLLSRFFISENSILEASSFISDQGNWYSFFCEMLGVGDLYQLINQTLPAIKEKIEHLGDLIGIQQQRYEKLMFVFDVKQLKTQKERNSLKQLVDDLDAWGNDPSDERIVLLWNRLRFVKLKQAESLRTELKTVRQQLLKMEKEGYQPLALDSKAGFGLEDSSIEQRAQILKELNQKVSKLKDLLRWFFDNLSVDPSIAHLEQTLMSEYLQDGGGNTVNPLSSIEDLNKYIGDTAQEISQYCQSAQKALNTFVSRFVDRGFKRAVEDLYAGHFLERGESFTIDISQLSSDTITITIDQGSSHTQRIPANRYFNMFRFRLFFLSIQSMLCIKMMQETGISFPLLFDDVFYANDYINKRQLVHFFQVLDKFIVENDRVKNRIQLIFFSHDEQLLSVIHGDQTGMADGTIYARMVDPSLVSSCVQSICPVKTAEGDLACCQVTIPIYTK